MDDDAEVFVACRERMALPELDGSSEAVLREHFSALVSVLSCFLGPRLRLPQRGASLLQGDNPQTIMPDLLVWNLVLTTL